MLSIRDQLRADLLRLRSGSNHAGLTVMDRRHGVIQMGQMGHTGCNALARSIVVRVRVGDRDGAERFRLADKFLCPRKLRRNIHNTDESAAAVL